jgi:hypothetical protein
MNKIDRPIFIVGSGRSGTTILYHMLCGHSRLAWLSNYNERWPAAALVNALAGLYRLPRLRAWRGKGLPAPSEAYNVWDRAHPVRNSPCDPPLTEAHATAEVIRRVRAAVAAAQFYHNKKRFVNKNTRHTRRMRYLHRIFPDALFLHVLRDPRAAVASLLKVDWWPALRVWSENQMTPVEWVREGRDPAVLAARLWVAEVECVLAAKEVLPAAQYHEVRYEAFVQNPEAALARALQFCGLPWEERFARFIRSFQLESRNFKFKNQLLPAQLEQIEKLAGNLARQCGYEFAAKASSLLVANAS